jgi:hypothetical protein
MLSPLGRVHPETVRCFSSPAYDASLAQGSLPRYQPATDSSRTRSGAASLPGQILNLTRDSSRAHVLFLNYSAGAYLIEANRTYGCSGLCVTPGRTEATTSIYLGRSNRCAYSASRDQRRIFRNSRSRVMLKMRFIASTTPVLSQLSERLQFALAR